jgi:hypothetical protein
VDQFIIIIVLGNRGGLPCLALSSLRSLATSSNLWPSRRRSRAFSLLLCFSQRMWRTLMDVAGLSLVGAESSFAGLDLFFGAML